MTKDQAVEMMLKHPIDDKRFHGIPKQLQGKVALAVIEQLHHKIEVPVLFKEASSKRLSNIAHLAVAAIAELGIESVLPYVKTPAQRRILHQVFGAKASLEVIKPNTKEKRIWAMHDLDI
ncbi:hypothetical protein P5704_024920 (plasmid) [Pseudomonas sp. FeN3W]|nr:hypothetical protein P5704_024920 [Pseudomonas sp. FeN3W]